MDKVKVLFIGDIVGKPGRKIVEKTLIPLRKTYEPDFIVANGENIAGGFGLTIEKVLELKSIGIDVITTGNHVWDRKEFIKHLDSTDFVLRPANYPPGVPGRGWGIWNVRGIPVGVLNLQGRVFMEPIDCPFRIAETIVENYMNNLKVIIVDFHAEATAEKICMAYFLATKVSAVLGTHTHVQTADERIIKEHTGYITDVGMCGPIESSIGIKIEEAMQRLLYQIPQKFSVAEGKSQFNGVYLEIEASTGRCLKIERIDIRE